MHTKFILKVLTLIFINSIRGDESCNTEEKACGSKCAKRVFKELLNGPKGLFGSINVLTMKNFMYETKGFKYEIQDATLSPMKNCVADVLLFDGCTRYEYSLRCSQLVLRFQVTARGHLCRLYIDGSDTITITADDVVLTANGEQGSFVDTKDNLLHFYLTRCFQVNNEVHGKVTFQTENNLGVSAYQAYYTTRYCRGNWKRLEEILRFPILNAFMSEFIQKKLSVYIRATAAKNLI